MGFKKTILPIFLVTSSIYSIAHGQASNANKQLSYMSTEAKCGTYSFSKVYLNFLGQISFNSIPLREDMNSNCEEALKIDHLIGSVNEFYTNLEKQDISLFLVSEFSDASSDKFGLRIPLKTKLGPINDPIIVHEYGHSLFAWNAKKIQIFSPYLKTPTKAEKEDFLRASYYSELRNYHNKSYSEIAKVTSIDDRLVGRKYVRQDTITNPEQIRRESLVGAYNEFFADLITALYFKDSSIIYNSMPASVDDTKLNQGLIQAETPEELAELQKIYELNRKSRDFCEPKNDIQIYDFSLSVNTSTHSITAPVRYEVCKRYFSKGNFDQGIALKTLAAIEKSLLFLFDKKNVGITLDSEFAEQLSINAKKINLILIDNL